MSNKTRNELSKTLNESVENWFYAWQFAESVGAWRVDRAVERAVSRVGVPVRPRQGAPSSPCQK